MKLNNKYLIYYFFIQKIYQPTYTLKWKFEDEKSDDDEIVVSELQSVNKLQFLKVSSS